VRGRHCGRDRSLLRFGCNEGTYRAELRAGLAVKQPLAIALVELTSGN